MLFFKLYLLYRTIAVNHQMVEYYLFELEAHLIKAVLRFTDALTPENYAYVLGKSFEQVANEVRFVVFNYFSNYFFLLFIQSFKEFCTKLQHLISMPYMISSNSPISNSDEGSKVLLFDIVYDIACTTEKKEKN